MADPEASQYQCSSVHVFYLRDNNVPAKKGSTQKILIKLLLVTG